MVQTVVGIEANYPDFAEKASVHQATLPLPKGWTVKPALEIDLNRVSGQQLKAIAEQTVVE